MTEAAHRSRFPDLVFRDVCRARASRVATMYSNGSRPRADEAFLERATVFVTHRCNLRCLYCNGPHLNHNLPPGRREALLGADMDCGMFDSLIGEWKSRGLRAIHFTGGEPTLNEGLPSFISKASDLGIMTAITSNGLAGPEVYRNLLDRGLYEIRFSIDSCDPALFDAMVGVPGAFNRLDASIREVVRLRDGEGRGLFLIFNVTVGRSNIESMESTIDRLSAYRPDDIKVLLVSEDREFVRLNGSRSSVESVLKSLDRSGREYVLLRDKLKHLFRRNLFGLEDHASRYLMRRCYVPLAERTLDAAGVFPCSVYLRYDGKPIASTTDSFERQQELILDFVENHNCREDEICLKNCLRCTRDFNLMVSRIIRDRESGKRHIIVDSSMERTDQADRMLEAIRANEAAPDRSFLIIKPYGLAFRNEIIDYLEEQEVRVLGQIPIGNWHQFSLFLYAREEDTGSISMERMLMNEAYRQMEGEEALMILVDPSVPRRKLKRLRGEIRDWLGSITADAELPGVGTRKISINAVHVPDEDRISYELQVAGYFLKGVQPVGLPSA